LTILVLHDFLIILSDAGLAAIGIVVEELPREIFDGSLLVEIMAIEIVVVVSLMEAIERCDMRAGETPKSQQSQN
jgi:hypothetical protein